MTNAIVQLAYLGAAILFISGRVKASNFKLAHFANSTRA